MFRGLYGWKVHEVNGWVKTMKSYDTLARCIVRIKFVSKVKSAETTRRVESLTADLSTIKGHPDINLEQ